VILSNINIPKPGYRRTIPEKHSSNITGKPGLSSPGDVEYLKSPPNTE
jgi:hypothetical protein